MRVTQHTWGRQRSPSPCQSLPVLPVLAEFVIELKHVWSLRYAAIFQTGSCKVFAC